MKLRKLRNMVAATTQKVEGAEPVFSQRDTKEITYFSAEGETMTDKSVTEKRNFEMVDASDDEIIAHALAKHPDCRFGRIATGMAFPFTLTRVVECYRNDECFIEGDKPRHTEESYPYE
jgi:hypothetical protein